MPFVVSSTRLAVRRHLTLLALCTVLGISLAAAPAGAQSTVTYTSPTHIFSLADLLGDLSGVTYAQDPSLLCGLASICPPDGPQPILDSSGNVLYPVDNGFGFDVLDFSGADARPRDGVYEEGFVGDLIDPVTGQSSGLLVVSASTRTFLTGDPIGTWCAGMGGEAVKCSSEHFTVMEHILTCWETVPYFYADPVTGQQQVIVHPVTGDLLEPCEELDVIPDAEIAALKPNDNTTITTDIAIGADYSVTVKDDGKPLYRWGNLIKKPTDIRFYARLPLPVEWQTPGANFKLVSAELSVQHKISNSPNDQLRPEDFENEGATGRLPDSSPSGRHPHVLQLPDGTWVSDRDCYEGDGDFIPAGTVLRNPDFARADAPSADLRLGLTNAWYTTLDRDPFEADPITGTGPRWRLKASKFGQDIPGLEIPLIECSQPPFEKSNIKYPVGEDTITTINLLDWEADGASPLWWSAGWAAYLDGEDGVVDGLSPNGLPLTEDFDLAIYVKGEGKPATLYTAQLTLEYEGDSPRDFGDAPAPYPTTTAEGGASHVVVDLDLDGAPDLFLGASIDSEPDGQPDALAAGDGADEDGVLLGPVVGSRRAELVVTASAEGFLGAWLDFNADGDWDDPREHLFVDQPLVTGENRLSFIVPSDVAAGTTFGRFRFSSAAPLSAAGPAVDGEVEDYAVAVVLLPAEVFSDGFESGDLSAWDETVARGF